MTGNNVTYSLNAMGNAIGYSDTLLARADTLFGQSLEQVNSRALNGNDIDCILGNGFAKEEFGHPIDGISLGWICSSAQLSNSKGKPNISYDW